MSMTADTALNILGMFAAYSVITLLLPHIIVGKSVRFRNGYERFLLYTICGNFYVMNIVYLLELLHISNKVTLIVFTVIPLAYIKIRLEKIPFKEKLYTRWEWLRKFTGGQLRVRAYREQTKAEREKRNRKFVRKTGRLIITNLADFLLILGLFGAAFYVVGTNLFTDYGYKLTDVVVHNFLINKLSENDIFTKGVYPYGYHNMLYYMHEVFGFDTYVLLRLMNLIVFVWVVLLLLCFLKLLCKSKYLPFIGAYAYALFNCFERGTYIRFCALIPQEYSMLFVFPTAYCAFAYFREQRREGNGNKAHICYKYLGGFLFSFSMAITSHFYGAIAVGIFIAAIALGFINWLIKWEYFTRLFITTMLSLLVAILPMGIAYATGTDLEYSLKWGLSIITGVKYDSGDVNDTRNQTETHESTEEVHESLYDYNLRVMKDQYGDDISKARVIIATMKQQIDYAVINTEHPSYIYILMISFVLQILVGLIYIFPKTGDKMYGAVLVSMGIFMIFMTVLVSAEALNLPQLMDLNRSSIFFAYAVCSSMVLFADSLLYLVLRNVRGTLIGNAVSLAVAIVTLVAAIGTGYIKSPMRESGFESNDAITCLTKIIKDCQDDKWTICSANDEGRMVYGHGFHYELIEFLRGMELVGSSGWIRIPTETVFFFVEKHPIDYYIHWEGSGTSISEDYAKMPLPLGNNRALYEGENRWICMSRYYYWAEEFRKLYPNETTIYYETDDFVCYRVEQNTYRLFNFAIDYGYNIPDNLRIGGE